MKEGEIMTWSNPPNDMVQYPKGEKNELIYYYILREERHFVSC